RLAALPATLGRLSWLDISGCTRLTALPEGLRVGSGIEIAGSGLAALPRSLAGVQRRWNGVAIDARTALRPETTGADQVLADDDHLPPGRRLDRGLRRPGPLPAPGRDVSRRDQPGDRRAWAASASPPSSRRIGDRGMRSRTPAPKTG